ncbi:MAG: hypothetical protein ABFR50_04795 [Candidatus Fermentibacteria bacterium]
MKHLAVIILIISFLTACTTRKGTELIDQEGIDRIRAELSTRTCQTRIDSLCFEIDGILYHAAVASDNRPLLELLPDTLPVCPESGLEYIISETGTEVTVTCPSGHGSMIVEK